METGSNENLLTVPSQSYVSAAKSTPKPIFPKRDQAIVFHAEGNLKLFEYVKAIGNIVGPRNVTYASRISNSRICIYLTTKSIVDELIVNHSTIKVGDMELAIRRLVTPSKRIILSNISPSISHETVEEELKKFGLNLIAPVSSLRAGMPEDEYGHVLSFRRQTYIMPPDDNFELQTSILIPCEGKYCRIFVSTDRMECFVCRQTGHKANGCPNASPIYTSLQTDKEESISADTNIPSSISHLDRTNFEQQTLDETSGRKRAHETSTSTSNDKDSPTSVENSEMSPPKDLPSSSKKKGKSNSPKPAVKKSKTEASDEKSIPTASKQAIHDMYEKNPRAFIIPFENFIAFLENTYGNHDPYSEALRFTPNVRELLGDMYMVYPNLKDRSLKYRFTRVTKKIKASMNLEGSEVDSLVSMTSLSSQDDPLEDTVT